MSSAAVVIGTLRVNEVVSGGFVTILQYSQNQYFFLKETVRNLCTGKVPHIFLAKIDSVFLYNTFEILMSL